MFKSIKKSVFVTLFLGGIFQECYAQFNVISSEKAKEAVQVQDDIQILGKPEELEKFIIPLEKIDFNEQALNLRDHSVCNNLNPVGLKSYFFGLKNKFAMNENDYQKERVVVLCVNPNDSTISVKELKPGYYEITSVIRLKEQLDLHKQRIIGYKFLSNPLYKGYDLEHMKELFNRRLATADEFERRVLLDEDTYYKANYDKWGSNNIYVLKDENGLEYYIDIYGSKIQSLNNIRLLFGTLEHYTRVDVPFYNICEQLKGKELAVYTKSSENYIVDYLTKTPIKNEMNMMDLWDYINLYRLDECFTSPLIYVFCKDVIVTNGAVCLILEHNKSTFSIKVQSRNEFKIYPEEFDVKPLYMFRGISKINKSWPSDTDIEICTKETIENIKRYYVMYREVEAGQAKKRYEDTQKILSNILEERKTTYISKYGQTFGEAVAEGKVMIGMTQKMCMDAWGYPTDRFQTTTSGVTTSTWMYNYKTYLYFTNGKLVKIKN